MTHFEAYHWEDHVPRPGNWKFNLAVSLLALGLISVAFPDVPADRSSIMSITARPAAAVSYPAIDAPHRDVPVALPRKLGQALHCPIATAEHADS